MQINYTVENDIGLVSVAVDMSAANIDQFKASFANWLAGEQGLKNIVFDMEKVESIDSSGLGALLGALKLVSERGGDLRIYALQKRVRIVFEITRAYKLFRIYDSKSEAFASFA